MEEAKKVKNARGENCSDVFARKSAGMTSSKKIADWRLYIMRSLCIILMLAAVLLIGASAQAALVGHWEFDGDASDSVGTATGTLFGDADASGTDNGLFGGAAAFPGGGGVIIVSTTALGTQPSWTIAAWVKTTATDNYAMLMGSGSPGGYEGFMMLDNFGTSTDFHINYNGTRFIGNAPYELGTWHHVALTYDGLTGDSAFYANGALIATGNAGVAHDAFAAAGNTFSIGGSGGTWSVHDYAGLVDDVRLYDTALSQQGVTDIVYPYNAGNPSPSTNTIGVDPAGLTMSWTPPSEPGLYNYDVYMSDGSSDPNVYYVTTVGSTSYSPSLLQYATEYNWRVDTKSTGGSLLATGLPWSFTTGGLIYNPSPADGSQKQGYDWIKLSWDSDGLADSFDVYIGTAPGSLALAGSTSQTELALAVDPNTPYYWRVDGKDSFDNLIATGDEWSFSTGVMIAYWAMDDATGLVATDASGNGYDLDLTSTVGDSNEPDWVSGAVRGAYNANGALTTHELNRGDSDQMTYCLWYKISPSANAVHWPGANEVVGDVTWDTWWAMHYRDDTNIAYIGASGAWTPVASIPENEWVHIALVFDRPYFKMYRNGVHVSTVTSNNPKSLENFYWVAQSDSLDVYDEIQLYDAALQPEVIQAMAEQSAFALNPTPLNTEINVPPGVVCEWDPGFDITGQEFQISTVSDFSTLVDSAPLSASASSYDPLGGTDLDVDTVYYWRVNSIQGSFTVEGSVWTFQTEPPIAHSPDPADTETGVAQNKILSWGAGSGYGSGGDNHQVYLAAGTVEGDLPVVPTATVSSAAYDPSGVNELAWNTAYVWRVDEYIGGILYAGDVWTFTTGAQICDPVLLGDTNGDCVVNLTDFANVAADWLACTLSNGDCP